MTKQLHCNDAGSPQENIDYHYDDGDGGIGRLTGIDDPSGQTAFEYDDHGNLIKDRRMIDGVDYTTRYEYNRANRVTKMIYPSGRIVHYEVDNLGMGDQHNSIATRPADCHSSRVTMAKSTIHTMVSAMPISN